MARTAIAPRDEFLPAIFRRRQLAIAQAQDPANPNLLAPQVQPAVAPIVEAPPELAPLNIVPTVPTLADKYKAAAIPLSINQEEDPTLIPGMPKPVVNPVEESNILAPPMVSRSGQVMNEDATRARRVETDEDGKPIRNIALSGNEQTLDLEERVAAYEPQKRRNWKDILWGGATGFARAGFGGAIGGAAMSAAQTALNPKLADQRWKRDQMAQLAPAVDSIRKNRKDQREEQRLDTQMDLDKARAEELRNPKAKVANMRIIERKDGVYAVDPVTMKSQKIGDIPAEAGSPGSTRYISRADGVYGINDAHPQGFKVSGIPGNPGKDVEDVTFGNQQIERAISEAQAEQKKIDGMLKQGMPDSIPRMIEGVDPLTGVRKQVSNPDYTYNMTRRRQLDDDIRNWRIKQKAQPKKAATASNDDNDPLGIFDDE